MAQAASGEERGTIKVSAVMRAVQAPAVPPAPALRRPRHRKSTRCSGCSWCRPSGPGGGVRLCVHPDGTGTLVIGDQMACPSFVTNGRFA